MEVNSDKLDKLLSGNKTKELFLDILSNEKERIKIAIMISSSKKEAAKLLNMSERNIHRKIKEYKL